MFLLLAEFALAEPLAVPRMETMPAMGEAPPQSPPLRTSVRMVEARWSSLSASTRSLPVLPPGVPAEGERLKCTVEVGVDARGVPEKVTAGACDEALRAATMAAAWRWRFRPAIEDGQAVPSETVLKAVVSAR